MSKYFTISNGLRGCYMPDNCSVIRVNSRRELKEYLACDAAQIAEGFTFGGSKRDIASIAATAWREAHKKAPAYMPYCLPFGNVSHGKPTYHYGVFVSVATRSEYLEYCAGEEQ